MLYAYPWREEGIMVKFEYSPDRLIEAGGLARAETTLQSLLAERLVAEGAIITLPGSPVTQYLVGHFMWLEPGRIFWFTAYGDTIADGHLLEFDQTRALESQISFARDRRIVADLTQIDAAGVDDPDDYRIAWQLWQEVAPLRAAMIERSFAMLTGLDTSSDEDVQLSRMAGRRSISAAL